MKKLYLVTILMLCAASLQAAQLYYQFPDLATLHDSDRMLVYQSNSGSRNLTGAGLKSIIRQSAISSTTITGLLKGNGSTVAAAIPGTDYTAPSGVAGGQSIAGGTQAGDSLTISSSTSGTKGSINVGGLSLNEATWTATLNAGKTTTAITDLLVNPAVKTSGNLIDLQVGGTSKFKVDLYGSTTSLGNLYNTGWIQSNANFYTPAIYSTGFGMIIAPWKYSSPANATASQGIQFIPLAGQYDVHTGGQQDYVAILPKYNQVTSTASNTDLLINRTETAIGSGTQNLLDAQVAGVSKFRVDRTGAVTTAGGIISTVTTYTGTATIAAGNQVVLGNGTFTLTLPTAVGITGKTYHIKNTGSGVVTVDADGSQTIDGALSIALSAMETITIVSSGAEWWII